MKVENQTIKSKKSEFFENFKKINNFLKVEKKKLKDKKISFRIHQNYKFNLQR